MKAEGMELEREQCLALRPGGMGDTGVQALGFQDSWSAVSETSGATQMPN